MRVRQRGNDLGFAVEILYIICRYLSVQHFDRRLHVKPQMLTKIYICKTALPQQAHKAVVTYLLTQAICHLAPSPYKVFPLLNFVEQKKTYDSLCLAYFLTINSTYSKVKVFLMKLLLFSLYKLCIKGS